MKKRNERHRNGMLTQVVVMTVCVDVWPCSHVTQSPSEASTC